MRERADSAADNFGAAGAAAMAALGYPSGMLVSGLVAYFKELAKAYEIVTDKLDLIGKAIATGDTSALEGDNDDYLKDLGKNLMEALRNGLIKGYVKAVVSTGVGQGLNGLAGTEPGSIGSRIINGLSNGGVSAADNALEGDDNHVTPDDVDRFGSALSQ